MADWIGKWRTNNFKVKDFNEFQKFIELFGDQVKLYLDEIEHRVALRDWNGSDHGELPCYYPDEDNEEEPVYLLDELHKYVAEGEHAVVIEVGSEKYFQLTGFVAIITSEGAVLSKDLQNIVLGYAKENNVQINMEGL